MKKEDEITAKTKRVQQLVTLAVTIARRRYGMIWLRRAETSL
jgi:hypothetical protein